MIGHGEGHDTASVRFQEFGEERLVLRRTPGRFAKLKFEDFTTGRKGFALFRVRKVWRKLPRGGRAQGGIFRKLLTTSLARQPAQHIARSLRIERRHNYWHGAS